MFVAVFLLSYALSYNIRKEFVSRFCILFLGFVYVSVSFFSLIVLREELGFGFTLLIFSAVWICDSAAFFVGRRFGKHKLAPKTSPNKTIEGAIGGMLFTGIYCFIYGILILQTSNLWVVLVVPLVVGTIGQVGDLFESYLKRGAGIKDSSNLLPGHGGVLDRFDSILFVAPTLTVLYLLLK